MFLKKFLYFNLFIWSFDYYANINKYLTFLYPHLVEYNTLSLNIINKNQYNNITTKGIYFTIKDNNHYISELGKCVPIAEKFLYTLKKIPININEYKIQIMFETNHKESIPIENIMINNINNYFFDYIKENIKYIDSNEIISFSLINKNMYYLNLSENELKKYIPQLVQDLDFLYLFYLIENIDYIMNEIYFFSPFTQKQMLKSHLINIIQKQIYMYVYNYIYKNF